MSHCLEEKEYATAREIFLNTFPNLLLCPSAHLMLSYVYKGQGNEKLAEFEEHVMLLLVHFIMQTGDGTESNPYMVLRITDEYDVLAFLKKGLRKQSLVSHEERFLDVLTCEDGSEIYFDVTDPFLRNTVMGNTNQPPSQT